MSIYLDLTEFLSNPVQTGIQRVTAEVCRHWRSEPLIPVKFDESSKRLTTLPPALVRAIADSFDCRDDSAIARVRALSGKTGHEARPAGDDAVLELELFYDPPRVAFFREMPLQDLDRYHFFVHDLMPLIHPEYFPSDAPLDRIFGYFSILRRIPNCGFNSETTQRVFCERLLRLPMRRGQVFRLGSDGLGPRPAHSDARRPLTFCVVGTIEPRKNPHIILEAFEPLLRRFPDMRLTFLGRMGWVDAAFSRRIKAAAQGEMPGVEWLQSPSDTVIRERVHGARATVYISAAEGFGLPPVESLWLGTPVIVSSGMPSLETVGCRGVEIVTPVDPLRLQEGVLKFVDDAYAARKAREARDLPLPTWASFVDQIAAWCGAAARA